MPFTPIIDLAALDRVIEDLTALRAALAVESDEIDQPDDEIVEPDLIDTASASSRFGLAPDSVRWLARENGMGQKRGGRWLIDVAALRKHVNRRVKRE